MATSAAPPHSETLTHPFERYADVPEQGRLARLLRRPHTRAVSIALWSRMFHHCRRRGDGSGEAQHYLAALLVALDLQDSDVDG